MDTRWGRRALENLLSFIVGDKEVDDSYLPARVREVRGVHACLCICVCVCVRGALYTPDVCRTHTE